MKRGDIIKLGNSYLMCGDSGDPEDVAKLFYRHCAPSLVFTSPPYLNRRDYERPIPCWLSLMQRVFSVAPCCESTQILINLGVVHKNNEYVPYWEPFIEWMRKNKWRRFAMYVWAKTQSLPGKYYGRLAPEHEFIFHFNRQSVTLNKAVACTYPNHLNSGKGRACKSGGYGGKAKRWSGTHKVLGSVITCKPASRWESDGRHPAVMPIDLPKQIYKTFTIENQIIYDPFCGSGTSIVAAECLRRQCFGMEIEEKYCEIVRERYHKWKERNGALPLKDKAS